FKSTLMSSDGGIYQLVKMSNLYKGDLDLSRNPSFISDVSDKQKAFLIQHNDILISLTGTIGKRDYGYTVLTKNPQNLLLNQRVSLIRSHEDKVDARYLLLVLKSPQFLERFFGVAIGGTGNQANVSINDLGE